MTSILGKAWLPALAILAAFAMFAVGNQVRSAEADIVDVDIVHAVFFDEADDCDEDFFFDGSATSKSDPFVIGVGEELALCIALNDATGVVSADSDDYGEFVAAYCGGEFDEIDECDVENLGNDHISIDCDINNCEVPGEGDEADAGAILLIWACEDDAAVTRIRLSQTDATAEPFVTVFDVWVRCAAQPDTVTVTAKPTKVEIIPQVGSVAHSEITVAISGDGLPVDLDDLEIDYSVPKCAIEVGLDSPDSSPLSDSIPSDDDFEYAFPTSGPNADKLVISNVWFHADWNNCTPGDVVVTVVVEVDDGADIVRNVTINVVGPPAFITATAAPTSLICGEKSTITVKVTDAIGQNVSDNTQVELISNWGSVIAGTGATLGFPGTGPVNPLASSAAATYNGVAIAYLLTSNNHVGPYEVVAAAGGTVGFDSYLSPMGEWDDPYYNDGNFVDDRHDYDGYATNPLLYSSAPITTQVTVTCALPAAPVAPTVTAPQTGTGSITPPNTGDAGLASSSSNAMLFVIVGAAAFVLAGIASVSYARR